MKSIIKITGILACIVVLFLNISLNGKSNSNHTDLTSLTQISQANAACSEGGLPGRGGRCIYGYDICVPSGSATECDP